ALVSRWPGWTLTPWQSPARTRTHRTARRPSHEGTSHPPRGTTPKRTGRRTLRAGAVVVDARARGVVLAHEAPPCPQRYGGYPVSRRQRMSECWLRARRGGLGRAVHEVHHPGGERLGADQPQRDRRLALVEQA